MTVTLGGLGGGCEALCFGEGWRGGRPSPGHLVLCPRSSPLSVNNGAMNVLGHVSPCTCMSFSKTYQGVGLLDYMVCEPPTLYIRSQSVNAPTCSEFLSVLRLVVSLQRPLSAEAKKALSGQGA